MAAELRWILLGLSLVLLGGIWWWGARRSAQAPGNPALRELTPSAEPQRHEPVLDTPEAQREPALEPETHEWGVSPLEPLSIRTGEYDRVPILDGPMMVNGDAAPSLMNAAPQPGTAPIMAPPSGRVPTLAPEPIDRSATAPAHAPNSSQQQRIITIRVCAAGDARWSGATLLAALESHGLAYGRYQVFHRRHVDGRSLFCVASLVEPGTFDLAKMANEEFRGVTLFAVLPGPIDSILTIDQMLAAARGLAQELLGMVQDAKGMPLSPQRAAALREDVVRFQASLPQA
jgi:cell division protein ZipA